MSEENNKNKKKCKGKSKLMLVYGILQLGSSVVSAIALTAIAISFCSIKEESKVFNNCVEEARETANSVSNAVHFCNGGK